MGHMGHTPFLKAHRQAKLAGKYVPFMLQCSKILGIAWR